MSSEIHRYLGQAEMNNQWNQIGELLQECLPDTHFNEETKKFKSLWKEHQANWADQHLKMFKNQEVPLYSYQHIHNAQNPEDLVEKLQREVNNCVNWLKDNRLCVAGDKSKILIVSTKQLRRTRLRNKLAIVVDQDIIEETNSEKLLGVVVNNNLTWKEHLYVTMKMNG